MITHGFDGVTVLGKNVKVHPSVTANLTGSAQLIIDDGVEIRQSTHFESKDGIIRICKGAVIGANNWFQGNGSIIVGAHTISGPNVVWLSTKHDIDGKSEILANPLIKEPLLVQRNCWIGANVTLHCGAIVSEGSVIGANSLMKGFADKYEIWGGVPAKFIRERNCND